MKHSVLIAQGLKTIISGTNIHGFKESSCTAWLEDGGAPRGELNSKLGLTTVPVKFPRADPCVIIAVDGETLV